MQSRIYYGGGGCDFLKDARLLARKALCCCKSSADGCTCYSCTVSLSQHPDYREYLGDTHSVEEIDEIVNYAVSTPMIANRRVVILNDLSTVTELSQNKLLKELEDNKSFVLIASASERNILPTIKSRTESVYLRPNSFEEFHKKYPEDAELLYFLSEGYMNNVPQIMPAFEVYKNVRSAFLNKDTRLLFESLHIVADKDKESFDDAHSGEVSRLFKLMSKLSTEYFDTVKAVSLLAKINEENHKYLSQKSYTHGDFFTAIANIADLMKGE